VIEDRERRWWVFGDYTGDACPNCGRERLMACADNDGKERIICEKCNWEPARGKYCEEALSD
jgi:ribosomal protein S27AE